MGVLGEGAGWCLCARGGRSERLKGSIFSGKGPAMASVSAGGDGAGAGAGFLIHRGLLLTTHANIPSLAAAEAAEIRLHRGRVPARLVPHRFFISSSVLDLTIVGLDTPEGESFSQGQQSHYMKTCCNPSLDLGSMVYLLGYTDKKDLMVGEGKVVIATDNLIKLSTDGPTWCPGSAGFDAQGNLAFMICDPMKLASSPTTKSSSASSASSVSWKKEIPMQFGIPIPIILDWLHQHWEGSLDEPSKPKLPLIRLMSGSAGQRSEHSCASFTMRQVFKPTEEEDENMSSSSQIISTPRYQLGSSCPANVNVFQEESQPANLRSIHDQGIPTPKIYESPKLTSGPLQKKEYTSMQLLDINFPPKTPKSIVLPLPLRQFLPESIEKNVKEPKSEPSSKGDCYASQEMVRSNPKADDEPLAADCHQGDCCSEVQSSSSPLEVSELRHEEGFSSGEETMYSAETMESRNFPSPKENRLQQVGRSQSCVNYSRWSSTQRKTVGNQTFKKQHSLAPIRKTHSQATEAPQRSHEYFSPTVSSSMKKRNNPDQPMRPRQNVVQGSPRWVF